MSVSEGLGLGGAGLAAAATAGASTGVVRATNLALKGLEAAGLELVELDRPSEGDFRRAGAAGLVVSRCEAVAFHREALTPLDRLWPETADQLRAAASVPAAEYIHALRIRAQLAVDVAAVMKESGVDALALPTTLVTAPLRSEADHYLTLLAQNVIPWSLLGWPAISVPCGCDSGLPVGIQIVAPPHRDALVLGLGLLVEDACGAGESSPRS